MDGVAYSRGFRRGAGVLAGLRILVVADREHAQALVAVLHLAGAEVLSIGEPRRALEILPHAGAHVLVVDRTLRIGDGRTVIEAMRGAGASWSSTPVLGLRPPERPACSAAMGIDAELAIDALPSALIRAVAELGHVRVH